MTDQERSDSVPTYKLILVGDGGVGKTTYLHRHLTGDFIRQYNPTLGVEVHPLMFSTNHGSVRFNVWDTAGQKKFGGLGDGYYVQAQCAIIMYDLTNSLSCEHVIEWLHSIEQVCGPIPIVLCGNKSDLGERKGLLTLSRENIQSFVISSKNNSDFELPFLWLARRLASLPDLVFVENPAMIPRLVHIDPEVMKHYHQEDDHVEDDHVKDDDCL
jgi:GTP-binding nuclear protein Ran